MYVRCGQVLQHIADHETSTARRRPFRYVLENSSNILHSRQFADSSALDPHPTVTCSLSYERSRGVSGTYFEVVIYVL